MTNNYFAFESRAYFDQPADSTLNPLMHTWSLGVEEQFYFIFPLMVLVAYGAEAVRSARGWALGCAPAVVLGIGFVASAVVSAWFSARAHTFAFYSLPCRLWELAAGSLCFEFLRDGMWRAYLEQNIVATRAFEVVAVMFIGLGLVASPHTVGFPWPWGLVPVLGTLSFIIAGASPHSCVNKYMAKPGLVYIGKLSYPIYLWHWPVFVMFHWSVGRQAVGYQVLACLVVAALSAIMHHVIEGPFQRWHPMHSHRLVVVIVAMLCISQLWLYLLSGPLFGKLSQHVAITDHDESLTANGANIFQDVRRCADTGNCRRIGSAACLTAGGNVSISAEVLSQSAQCRCRVSNATLTKHTAPFQEPEDAPDASKYQLCFVEQGTSIDDHQPSPYWNTVGVLEPDRGPDGKRKTVFLIGDSHSLHLRATFAAECGLFAQYSLKRYTTVGAPQDLVKFLESRIKPRDVIVLSYTFEKYHGPGFRKDFALLVRNLQAQAETKQAVIVLGSDVPRKTGYHKSPSKYGPACVPTKTVPNVDNKCFMSKAEVETEFAPLYQTWADLANLTGTFFFDYYQLMCTETTSSAMIPGTNTLAYKDGNHLSPAGGYYLWPYMCTAVASALQMLPPSVSAVQTSASSTSDCELC